MGSEKKIGSTEIETVFLSEEEEYFLNEIFVTDVDDLITTPKEYSLKISSANGTFFSNDFITKQLIFSYENNKNDRNLIFDNEFTAQKNDYNSHINSNSNFNSINFGGNLNEINSFISNLIYVPNRYFHGFDKIKIKICDSEINKNENRNGNGNQNKNQSLKENKLNKIEINEFSCVRNILPIIIKSINNAPYWSFPSIVETEEDSAFNFITVREPSSSNIYNNEELSFLNSLTSIQINDVDSFQNQIFIRLSVDLGSIFLPFLFDDLERGVGK